MEDTESQAEDVAAEMPSYPATRTIYFVAVVMRTPSGDGISYDFRAATSSANREEAIGFTVEHARKALPGWTIDNINVVEVKRSIVPPPPAAAFFFGAAAWAIIYLIVAIISGALS